MAVGGALAAKESTSTFSSVIDLEHGDPRTEAEEYRKPTTLPLVTRPGAAFLGRDSSARCLPWTHHNHRSFDSVDGIGAGGEERSEVQKIHKGTKWVRHATTLPIYQRLFTLVVLGNAAALLYLLCNPDQRRHLEYKDAATATALNLLVAVTVRNEHVVNALYILFCVKPTWLPLRMRIALSQVHQYGGVHSGCAVAATMWYCLLTGLITYRFQGPSRVSPLCLAVTWLIWVLLFVILVFAYPSVREKIHDHFEIVHRFAGWSAVFFFWLQLFSLTYGPVNNDQSFLKLLLSAPAFWCLILMTGLLIYPWLRIRKRRIFAEHLSDHAVRLHFRSGDAAPCTAVKLSDNPLRQNHAFACIPDPQDDKSFSVIVSNAGDWTQKLIRNPPESIWIRETPQRGVLWVARMFSPVVIVATGSGIGPCLGLFNGCPTLACRVIWSAQQPEATYGQGVVSAVLRADPRATIIDTRVSGRPNLEELAYKLYLEVAAEAVVVISNRKLTKAVVAGLNSRGLCARGPIWDS